MPQAKANGITIEYDTFGDPQDPALLLIMGFGAQMTHWDEDFCQALADTGHHVIRHDNRDVGLSEKIENADSLSLMELMAEFLAGGEPEVPYTLVDMANDSVGLLEALGVERAHICGASMGGMIAQRVACHHPEKTLSLTSIMSATGNPDLPTASEEAQTMLLAPRPDDRDSIVERAIRSAEVIGSPGFEKDLERIADKALAAFDRSFYPMGIARQFAAIAADGDRRPLLQELKVPTLVIHGTDDPLVPVEAGHDTALCIEGAELLLIEGMGHDLPPAAWPRVIDAISMLTGAAAD